MFRCTRKNNIPEVCGGRLLTGRLVAVAGECGIKIRLGGGGTHGVNTYYYIIIIIIIIIIIFTVIAVILCNKYALCIMHYRRRC